MLFVFYQHTPVPDTLTRNDQILPLFVVSHVPHGLAGFIVAAIVAAALSPSLNAMAATTVSDFYLPYINPEADQATQMRVSKLATVAWGIVQLGVAIGAQLMERSVLDAGLAVLSFASGPVLGAFLVGDARIRHRRSGGVLGHGRRPRGHDRGVVGRLRGIHLVRLDRRDHHMRALPFCCRRRCGRHRSRADRCRRFTKRSASSIAPSPSASFPARSSRSAAVTVRWRC